MDSDDQLLSFLDLLDLDEEIVDSRLRNIMSRTSHSNKHLSNALQLLKYKNLINLREDSQCENEEEYTFVSKVINAAHDGNVDLVCKIIFIILGLNRNTLVSRSEHLFQQILCETDLPYQKINNTVATDAKEEIAVRMLLNLKLCDTILDVVISNGEKLSLPFLDIPLEEVLSSHNEKLKLHFLNSTVPRLFQGVIGFNIMDRIWSHIKKYRNKDNVLKILSLLSEFYLPVPDSKDNIQFKSELIFYYEFWNILLHGLNSSDPAARKLSAYLIKRAIDSVTYIKRDFLITFENVTIFSWQCRNMKCLKETWNNFFVLIDSLEEKQSNIVLPSLQLFKNINHIPRCWLQCAFNIGLKHDNAQVRLKCIEYRLKTPLNCLSDAVLLMEALNDTSLYDNEKDRENIKISVSEAMKDTNNLVLMVKAMCKIKWIPVPFYHITDILDLQDVDLSMIVTAAEFSKIIIDILKVPCNNKILRHAVKINLTYFIGQCYKDLNWNNIIHIYSSLKCNRANKEIQSENPFMNIIKNINLQTNEKEEFLKEITSSYNNVDFGHVYLETHKEDIDMFMKLVKEKVNKIQDITKRQYSNKSECLNDILFILHIFDKVHTNTAVDEIIANTLSREYKTVSYYLYALLQSGVYISIEETELIFEGFNSMHTIEDNIAKNYLHSIYQYLALILEDISFELHQKLYAVNFIASIMEMRYQLHKHSILNMKELLLLLSSSTFKENCNANDVGRYKNAFYEKCCKIVYKYISLNRAEENTCLTEEHFKGLIEYVENIVECGGHGCLKWVLKIVNIILPEILKKESIKFNIAEFISRMWQEIEELKSNNQYSPCIEQFAELITHDELLTKEVYNNVIVLYCSKIIEYGSLKNDGLYFLVTELNKKSYIGNYGHLMYILTDILLFCSVPKKDHRIAENLAVQILEDPKYAINSQTVGCYFNYQIQYTAIMIMSKVIPEIHESIASVIISKLEEHFRNKWRYHGNSHSHRLLLQGLQHLLYLNALGSKLLESEKVWDWAIEFLGRLPHQPSVRTCLEWYIAINFCLKNLTLTKSNVDMLKDKNVPLISQFMICFWTIKYRMSLKLHKQEEYEFVMDFLLSYTMGQTFNIRLLAQYLSTQLFKEPLVNKEKYVYIMEVIEKTFTESSKDKNFLRLKEDYFIKSFDPVTHLTAGFIYYFLPRYFDVQNNEDVDESFIKDIIKELFQYTTKRQGYHGDNNPVDDEVFTFNFCRRLYNSNVTENEDAIGTIQKKYIPWKNMSDIVVCGMGKKKESSSELIVVASLIDKLPNLGGMARTSEVFGVKTYVVDNLRHLQDKQFQGLSVSAERWVNTEEVRPGQPLKDYIMAKKHEGYSIVAAEQTSSSVQLQKFRFQKKTLLLLGHEKEGVPCDLLPFMDHCVEIPQQGFVRSLNVHVTASIFIWEYSRQNIL